MRIFSMYSGHTMWCIVFSLFVLSCSVLGQVNNDLEPRVTTSQGTVVGSRHVNRTYYEFYGIPYADSTSGTHRFKAPSAPPIFQEEFIANRQNVKCVRALGFGFEGTEDCLIVDIITPSLETNKNLPVMVWVKGKDLENTYVPELTPNRFMQKDVVVVSLNYRESILGFLCLGTETAPGNAGLKDIVAGLNWVQENIANFGGDPENIVLFGHGSGGAAVDLITLSSQAKGLVHKAIAQSGTATAPWAMTRNNLKYAVEVAKALGHTITDIQNLSEVFTRVSLPALMAAINELELTDNSLAFAPCIENSELENVEPFLLKTPYEIITDGEQLQIPFMTGFVDVEGTLRTQEALFDNWLEKMENSFSDFIQPDLQLTTAEESLQVTQEIRTFYFGDDSIDFTDMDQYLSYHGDTTILVSAIREARMRAETSSENIYLYQFSHSGRLSDIFARPFYIDAAGHNEELIYLFHNENLEIDEYDRIVGNILLERWTNFAWTGVPTSETSAVEWIPFTVTDNAYLRILDESEITNNTEIIFERALINPHPLTLAFWNNMYESHFLDAYSRWDLNGRDEDDTPPVEEEEPLPVDVDDGTGVSTPDPGDEDGGEEPGAENPDDNVPDSASSSVAYTFTILTSFAVLNKFNMLQLTS